MRFLRCTLTALCLGVFFSCIFAFAQKEKREPLTETQIEQIREAGIDPNERIHLYTKFLDEHADALKSLVKRNNSVARTAKLDDTLQDFTALLDELGSNLDVYSERKADIRRSLKPLQDASQNWMNILKRLSEEKRYDVSRKEAIDSCQDVTDEAKQILEEQTTYFDLHKDERGQERAEPK